MSYTNFTQLDTNAKDQLACTLAALILNDEGSDVTGDAISKIVKAANITVAPYWPMLLGKALEGRNVADLLKVSGGGSAPAPAQDQAAGNGAAPAKDEKPAAPVEEEEDVDMDMGDLFG